MKPENKFRKWFLEKFQGHMNQTYPGVKITVQKHADYATDGIADIDLSINGMTCWLEVKLLTSCKEERKLNVTPLQRAYLEGRAKGGVPTGLLVGLALGPRKGYDVALFIPPISEVVHRDMFRQHSVIVERIYSMVQTASFAASQHFKNHQANRPCLADYAGLGAPDTLDSETSECGDVAGEDGG